MMFYFHAYDSVGSDLGTFACNEAAEESAANLILTECPEVTNLVRQVHVVLPVVRRISSAMTPTRSDDDA